MGFLREGKWINEWYDTASNGGKFVRSNSQFRNWITHDGRPGPNGERGFKAEPNRYHLYVSLACPWAHRTLIFRALKGLEKIISLSVVHWFMGEKGWPFQDADEATGDQVNGVDFLYQIYTLENSSYSGRVTVPILWDKKLGIIVSNESSEIIRMLNTAFDSIGAISKDYYPKDKRDAIDDLNKTIYHDINNGVYKVGFATTQEAYEEAVISVQDHAVAGYILFFNGAVPGPVSLEVEWH